MSALENAIDQSLRESLVFLLAFCAPPVVAALASGLLVAIIQSATQVQEQTTSFAARFISVVLTLALAASWYTARMQAYAESTWERAASTSATRAADP